MNERMPAGEQTVKQMNHYRTVMELEAAGYDQEAHDATDSSQYYYPPGVGNPDDPWSPGWGLYMVGTLAVYLLLSWWFG